MHDRQRLVEMRACVEWGALGQRDRQPQARGAGAQEIDVAIDDEGGQPEFGAPGVEAQDQVGSDARGFAHADGKRLVGVGQDVLVCSRRSGAAPVRRCRLT